MRSWIFKLQIFLFTIILFTSCNKVRKNDPFILASLDRGLSNSTQNIESWNHSIYAAIEGRAAVRETKNYASIWQPRALRIKDYSDNLVGYIESFKTELREQAGLRTENGRDTFNRNDQSAVRIIYNKRGKELLEKLNNYKITVLREDSLFKNHYETTLPVDFIHMNNSPAFRENYFENTTTMSALAVLSNFQASVRKTENLFIYYCFDRCTFVAMCGYGKGPSYLVSQSSSIVKKGEKITITAGIGTFFSNVDPVFHFAGKEIPINSNGAAVYEFKASTIPGKHQLPVTIEYYKDDGTKDMRTIDVVYEVRTGE